MFKTETLDSKGKVKRHEYLLHLLLLFFAKNLILKQHNKHKSVFKVLLESSLNVKKVKLKQYW